MSFIELSAGKWPRLGRQQKSKRDGLPDSKRNDSCKSVQSSEAASGRKFVLLHDWWLVKVDPDSPGKRLGIGGFTVKENQGIRSFSSAPIVKRHDAVTLQTVDSIKIVLHGYLNKFRSLENGFSLEVCDHFQIGFPYYWEDFASLSVNEEQDNPSASKGVSPSYSYKTPPAQEARGSNMASANISDAILTESPSVQKEACVPIQNMESAAHAIRLPKKRRNHSIIDGGPLTRSRARLLGK